MTNINNPNPYNDFINNLKNSEIWFGVSLHDIKQRYKRSIIGPFWVTISTSIIVFFLSILYSQLFNLPLATYLPYIAVSIILWNLFSSIIIESCEVFVGSSQMLLQLRLPFYFYIFRLVSRNFIILFHNSILLLIIIFLYPGLLNLNYLFFIPISLIIYFFTGISIGMILGIFCTRFRDITQIVISIIQLSFFLTPILWKRDMVQEDRQWIIDLNIFNHYLDIFRLAFLNQEYSYNSLLISIVTCVIFFIISFLLFLKFKKKINYWL